MKNLEDRIKATKPSVPEVSPDFSRRVLSQIDELGLTVQPIRALSLFLQWLRLIAGVIFLVIGLVTVNNFIFEIRMNGSLEMLYFGTAFLNDMLRYIPWDTFLPALLITGFASWLVWNSHLVKRGIAVTIAACYLVTGIGGVALANSGMNEQLQAQILREKREWPLVSWFYKERARFFVRHPNFNMGQVVQSNSTSALVVDPYGNRLKIVLPPHTVVKKGQFLRLRGEGLRPGIEARQAVFKATDVHFCGPGKVGRYFQGANMMSGHMKGGMMRHRTEDGVMRHRMMHRNRAR